MIAVLFFSGIVKSISVVAVQVDDDFGIVFEEDYFLSQSYIKEVDTVVGSLTQLVGVYKNEENILKGGTISKEDIRIIEGDLYSDFEVQSRMYKPSLSHEQNQQNFQKEYAEEISHAKNKLIANDLEKYHLLIQNLEQHNELLYYGGDGVNEYKNSSKTEDLRNYPSSLLFDGYKSTIYPEKVKKNEHFHLITSSIDQLNPKNTKVYVAFQHEILNLKINEWEENKAIATKEFYLFIGCLIGFLVSFVYLVFVIGRNSFKDNELHFNKLDKLFNDVSVVLLFGLTISWVALMDGLTLETINKMTVIFTIPFSILGLLIILSIVKHIKNGTIIKHTLIYLLISKLCAFIRNVYNSGSTGVKTVLIVIGYPILVALTFFIFPITLGFAAWFAYKRIKKFNAIKEGVERIKQGDIHHRIIVEGKGEFARLSDNINSITDGLKKAVDSELKNERLKTELITNVSHDIRTPLTSIITYVDLLKKEKDPSKIEEYVEVLDQKSKRLKVLTDDLFEAAKATSGTIPVHLERIDILSLLTQGLGEVNAKIEALDLTFKINHPDDRLYISADGKLLWRSVENLLSNIFKYALRGSRVYIDIEDKGNEILLTFKNISAYELNISADELMERFKRGDESRNSQGSGLGLSIAKSLIDIQKGQFIIQVDGDLFKAMISMPKYQSNE
jgi:signal transduction histidine kinase